MNFLKSILSQSTYKWIALLVATFFYINVIYTGVLFSYIGILSTIGYALVVTWFLTKNIKKILLISIGFLAVLISSSFLSVTLENNYPSITGVLFPSIFFLYFGLYAGSSWINNNLKFKNLIIITITFIDLLSVFIIYTVMENLSIYISLIIAINILALSLAVLYIFKDKS